jgi:hypothetical protein
MIEISSNPAAIVTVAKRRPATTSSSSGPQTAI